MLSNSTSMPGEDFAAFVRRMQNNSSMGDIPVPPKPARQRVAKFAKPVRKLLAKAADLDADQVRILVALIEGNAVLLSIRGEAYATWKEGSFRMVRSLAPGSVTHSVHEDLSRCSCSDNRFRGEPCKHMEALEAVR